jgi:hypothetical protein
VELLVRRVSAGTLDGAGGKASEDGDAAVGESSEAVSISDEGVVDGDSRVRVNDDRDVSSEGVVSTSGGIGSAAESSDLHRTSGGMSTFRDTDFCDMGDGERGGIDETSWVSVEEDTARDVSMLGGGCTVLLGDLTADGNALPFFPALDNSLRGSFFLLRSFDREVLESLGWVS